MLLGMTLSAYYEDLIKLISTDLEKLEKVVLEQILLLSIHPSEVIHPNDWQGVGTSCAGNHPTQSPNDVSDLSLGK